MFYTGRTRSASLLLADQSTAMRSKDRRELMRRMVQLAFEMKEQLESGTLNHFGDLLDENWRLKAQLVSGITDTEIDTWYNIGIRNGALGGKLLGAGIGGFLMFYAEKNKHEKIIKALSGLSPVNFKFETSGSQIVFYQPAL